MDATYRWLLALHVVGAALWTGGVAMLAALGAYALRLRDPGFTSRLLGSLRVVGPALLAPAPLIVLALGAAMVSDSAAWSWDQGWLRLGVVLFAAVFLVGAGHQAPTGIAATRAAERGDHPAALRHLRRWAWGMAVLAVLLVVAIWDMAYKPGL